MLTVAVEQYLNETGLREKEKGIIFLPPPVFVVNDSAYLITTEIC